MVAAAEAVFYMLSRIRELETALTAPSASQEALREALDLDKAVSTAALTWCGEKDRETFQSDVDYFKHNWRAARLNRLRRPRTRQARPRRPRAVRCPRPAGGRLFGRAVSFALSGDARLRDQCDRRVRPARQHPNRA